MAEFNTKSIKKVRRKNEEASLPAPSAPVEGAAPARVWSPQQSAIFDWCRRGEGSLVVTARAGTGKTTTIVEAVKALPSRSVLLCAFNKRIAEELGRRVAGAAHVYTLHGLGFRLWRRAQPNTQVDEKRGYRLAEDALKSMGVPPLREFKQAVRSVADIAKQVNPYTKNPSDLVELGYTFGFFEGLSDSEVEKCAVAAIKAMQLAVDTKDGVIDFTDMLYLPLMRPTTRGEYDYVVVDEAQDMNRAQLDLALQVLKKGNTGLIVVGDDRQAIYGFRGADSNSLKRLREKMQAVGLGLTTTYRCPKKVVAVANTWVKDFQAAESAPEGVVRATTSEKLIADAQPGDFIISRTNAPLFRLCLDLVAAGKRAKVEGRDVGKMLVNIIDKLKASTTEEMLVRLDEWERRHIQLAGEDEAAAAAAMDTAEALRFLAKETNDLNGLRSLIDSMFEDSTPGVVSPRVTLMTVHKSKGLEAERVFILCDTFRGGFMSDPSSEEANLRYVAVTRAKNELVFVNPDWEVKS